jgi:hypothetical protein
VLGVGFFATRKRRSARRSATASVAPAAGEVSR